MKLLHALNAHELPFCLLFNRINRLHPVSRLFAGIRRLGNGSFWYGLMGMLPLLYGWQALPVVLHMAGVGLVGVTVYKWLKSTTARVRPFRYDCSIFQNVAALDQFSFPSGHTLHATGFAWVVIRYYPEWSLLLVPFAVMTGLSRVVLGLHYPSDVLIGAFLGAGIAKGSFCLLSYC